MRLLFLCEHLVKTWLGIAVLCLIASSRVCADSASNSPAIVCTTTHLSALVETLSGDRWKPQTILAWGLCPGHFELKPAEIELIRRADLVLEHGYESFLASFKKQDSLLPVASATVLGNWMIPSVQKVAAQHVAAILTEHFPSDADMVSTNLQIWLVKLDLLEKEILDKLAPLQNQPVASSVMIADYVKWMGLKVVAEFPRDESLSLRTLQETLAQARAGDARMVIDNQQSSGKAGATLARELKLPLVMLGNFPEPDGQGRVSYEFTLRKHAQVLCP